MPRGFNQETNLGFYWSETERDWMIYYPCTFDGLLIHSDLLRTDVFKELVRELDERGYDIKTLRFSVKKRRENCDEK